MVIVWSTKVRGVCRRVRSPENYCVESQAYVPNSPDD